MVKITQFKGTEPFEAIDITTYRPIEDVLDVEVSIIAVKHYENEKGPGVAVAIDHPVHGECYINTHSVGIVTILSNKDLMALLDVGETVEGTFVKRKSKKSDRMVYALE